MSEDTQEPVEEPTGIGGSSTPEEAPATPSFDFESESFYKDSVLANLPEEYRENQTLTQSKSMKSLIEQTLNAQSALGRKRLEAPQADWDDAKWGEYYAQIRPETADSYEGSQTLEIRLDEGGDLQQYEFKEQTTAELKQAAHELGLHGKQFNKLEKIWATKELAAQTQAKAAEQQAVQEHTNELRKEWGDGYSLKHKAANEAFEQLAGEIPELNELVNWSPVVANHPAVMKLFERLSPMVKDMPMPNGGAPGSFGNETVAGLKAQIQQIDAENQSLLYGSVDQLSPADKVKRERLLKERTELYQKMYK